MNKRPSRKDTEDDILEMQRAFLAEKAKNTAFQPAASIVKPEKAPKKSIFAKSREKQQNPSEHRATTASSANNVKNIVKTDDAKVNVDELDRKTTPSSNLILGDIVEKTFASPKETSATEANDSFPKVERVSLRENCGGKSLFALSFENKITNKSSTEDTNLDRKRQHDEMMMIMDCEPIEKNPKTSFGDESFIVEDQTTATAIHEENLEILRKMKESDILEEQQQIMQSVDPALIEFLAKKRKQKLAQKQMQPNATLSTTFEHVENNDYAQLPEGNPAVELLKQSTSEKWINFDVVEKDKLDWMRDIPLTVPKLEDNQPYEARFDWKGVLLPHTDLSTDSKDNRELYLHGDEPSRPGYTLQELFRLARSNVIQQRVSAYSAIGGILNIYNQGFYDNVLEVPIAKIFFLLRFGLDENTLVILEVVSKALALMFYNETDETLLDFTYENTGCYWQPKLEVNSIDDTDDPTSIESLQKQMKNLKVSSSLRASVEETEEESKTSMTDFQLAETDLIECLLRSNIIQRIYFILSSVKPDNSTVVSCLKILIRIARTNKNSAMHIFNSEDLITCMFTNFLPGLQSVDTTQLTPPFYKYPQYLVLKLCRILISQSLSFALKLISLKIVDRLQNYLFNQEDIKQNLILVQIESLRVFRSLMLLRPDNALYSECVRFFVSVPKVIINCLFRKFLPAFRYMLEWHYHHVVYERGGPYLIRQHAAALLCAISSGPNGYEVSSVLGSSLVDCSSNWFHKATKCGVEEFSQSTLLTSCLNAVVWFIKNNDLEKFKEFLGKYLKNFLESEAFVQFEKSLNITSIVLRSSDVIDRRNVFPALPNAGAILMQKHGPQLAIPQTYCIYFLTSLWQLVEQSVKYDNKVLVNCLTEVRIIDSVVEFIKNISNNISIYLRTNFFAKCELRLIFKLLCFDGFKEFLGKATILRAVYNYLGCLSAEHIPEIERLFEKVIFNREYISSVDEKTLDKWRNMYLEVVYPHYVVVSPTEISLSIPFSAVPILPTDWPYFQLKAILEDYVQNVHQRPAALVSEGEVVRMTLTFTSILENESFQITTPTEKLMYLMITFMGPDSQFLEPTIKSLLRDHLMHFFQSLKDISFEFDKVYEGKCKFQNLYALFVDHFQAASYGDDLFSAMVLVPLAQKYDNKWRRMIWSEHASVLRFLNCDESLLIGGLDAYLNPPEVEESLINCYVRALCSNSLRPNTIVHKIAQHHVEKYNEIHKKS
ncbi:RNA polymerase II-associated protein 1 [Eupeodes corollae]|uniref:RNA polymerase II-associated protein 1 n=1 Tax=Eupeodes corollae TaxID=290404 RepID=UPI0024901377|nr:RNA polymerase II-associated protein 1 [Eupeodes corollae]